MTTPSDPLALLRSRNYAGLLVLAAIIGLPVSAASYFFLALVSKLQVWVFADLPKAVGFHSEPLWWPLLPLLLAGHWSASLSGTCPARAATHLPTGSRWAQGRPRRPSFPASCSRRWRR